MGPWPDMSSAAETVRRARRAGGTSSAARASTRGSLPTSASVGLASSGSRATSAARGPAVRAGARLSRLDSCRGLCTMSRSGACSSRRSVAGEQVSPGKRSNPGFGIGRFACHRTGAPSTRYRVASMSLFISGRVIVPRWLPSPAPALRRCANAPVAFERHKVSTTTSVNRLAHDLGRDSHAAVAFGVERGAGTRELIQGRVGESTARASASCRVEQGDQAPRRQHVTIFATAWSTRNARDARPTEPRSGRGSAGQDGPMRSTEQERRRNAREDALIDDIIRLVVDFEAEFIPSTPREAVWLARMDQLVETKLEQLRRQLDGTKTGSEHRSTRSSGRHPVGIEVVANEPLSDARQDEKKLKWLGLWKGAAALIAEFEIEHANSADSAWASRVAMDVRSRIVTMQHDMQAALSRTSSVFPHAPPRMTN